jgi:hypothetical protein
MRGRKNFLGFFESDITILLQIFGREKIEADIGGERSPVASNALPSLVK